MSNGIKQRIDQNIRDTNQFWNTAIEEAAALIEGAVERVTLENPRGRFLTARPEGHDDGLLYAAAVRRLKR